MVKQNTQNNRKKALKILANNFYRSHKWPNQIRNIIYENHEVNNKQRFITYVFFLNNGLSPDQTQEVFENLWVLDNESQRQITYLRKQWEKGWKYKSWEVENQDQGKNLPSVKWKDVHYRTPVWDPRNDPQWGRRERDLMSDSE